MVLAKNSSLAEQLIKNKWLSPDTYGREFSPIPSKAGVYLFYFIDLEYKIKDKILYVGKSINLENRHQSHEVLGKINKQIDNFHFIKRWFKILPEYKITSEEINLIKKYSPPFNLIHREKAVFNA